MFSVGTKPSNVRHKKYDMDESISELSIGSAEAASKRNLRAYQMLVELGEQRQQVRLLNRPIETLGHFTMVLWDSCRQMRLFMYNYSKIFGSILVLAVSLAFLSQIPGSHLTLFDSARSHADFILWWTFLGILSSIGLGTGLHTFVLYTGPFIAKTTIAAGECNSLNFDTYGGHAFICPDMQSQEDSISVYQIFMKVQLAVFLWGAGTAIGEMPPYFVSRAARSAENRATLLLPRERRRVVSIVDRLKSFMVVFLDKFGFWAIVLCASIPNPLFDLAGLTCGHFGVDFWTFFSATFIGKALVKAHLQALIVVMMFHKSNLKLFIQFLDDIILPESWAAMLDDFFQQQKDAFHEGATETKSLSLFQIIWQIILICMVTAFVVTMIDALVQERLVVLDEQKVSKLMGSIEDQSKK